MPCAQTLYSTHLETVVVGMVVVVVLAVLAPIWVAKVIVARRRERKKLSWFIIPRQPAGRSVQYLLGLQGSSLDSQIFPQERMTSRN